jgi:threonyl-tRNA synthetase
MDYPIEVRRHSAAHVMAAAVKRLFPQAKFGVGPAIDNGFYYDIDIGRAFTPEDLKAIDKEMRKIVNQEYKFVREEMGIDEGIELFKSLGQDYKVELLNDIKTKGTTKVGAEELGDVEPGSTKISVYKTGDFVDLCRGPHVGSVKDIGVWKLNRMAAVYWRGKESNPQLQRVYGLCFATEEELAAYEKMMEEAEKRDHRKLGKELEIFMFDDEVGPGLPLWLPNGGVLIEELEKLAKDMETAAGYVRVRTPHLTKEELYLRSGHLPYYADSMFPPMELDGERYYVKPMNCPMHHKIFGNRPRSYRELPLRLAEYGTCYRYEKSGELFGLMRVRSMQMNDAHIYCSEEQFEEEFMAVIAMYQKYFELFGIKKYSMRLSTHSQEGLGKKYVDNERLWLKTEEMVRNAMLKHGIPFVEVANEAAFYGPKIDVQIWSAIGREFTLATNQVDFAVPERFNLAFINSEGKPEVPLVIHRAPLSTHERMIGFLIEHYAGAFPLWLAPIQVAVLPVADRHNEFAYKLAEELKGHGVRAEVDDAAESVGKKIRNSEKAKIPLTLVVGDKEAESGDLTIRRRGVEEQDVMPKADFIAMVVDTIKNRK